MDISFLYQIFTQHQLVTTDSRSCPKGAIFFALKGEYFDGNQFAEAALNAGCSYAIVDDKRFLTRPNIILVKNSLEALLQLANYHRRLMKTPIIAISGTNGKTTTKELVTEVLSKEHKVLACSSSSKNNNLLNAALTLLSLTKEHEIAVIKMIANTDGDISKLCTIVEPNYGLITHITEDYMTAYGTFENLIRTKKELYDYIYKREHGQIFVNYDNSILKELSKDMPAIYYGLDLEYEQFVTGRVLSANPHLVFEWKMAGKYHLIKTKLPGNYNLSNVLAAITIGKYFGINGDLICEAIANYKSNTQRAYVRKNENRNVLFKTPYKASQTNKYAYSIQ